MPLSRVTGVVSPGRVVPTSGKSMAADSRDLNDLEPGTRAKALDFLDRCTKDGIKLLVTNTFRPASVQAILYARGRTDFTKGNAKVTWARPGSSWHQFRCALDIVPIIDGKISYKTDPESMKIWQRIGAHGRAAGLEWGGDWKKLDMPHFQNTEGMTLSGFRAKYGLERPKDFE